MDPSFCSTRTTNSSAASELLETYHLSLLEASEERRAAREAASKDREVLMQALTAIALKVLQAVSNSTINHHLHVPTISSVGARRNRKSDATDILFPLAAQVVVH